MTVRLALSIGCPCGVGPEVSVVAASALPRGAKVVLVGSMDAIARAAKVKRVGTTFVELARAQDGWGLGRGAVGVWNPSRGSLVERSIKWGKPRPEDGAAQLAWVDAACDLASSGAVDAMVTGPVSKEIIVRSRAPGSAKFLGHTEHLERRLHAREVVMAFASDRFTTSLATTHLAIADVPRAITKDSVARAAYWLAKLLFDLGGGKRAPKIAICGLNPHAGERGLIGKDEPRAIVPGIAAAKKRLGKTRADFVGPMSAEAAFRYANDGKYDGVVAMYHDQATIPMKLVGFGESVNVTLGLPIIRTSVDHGTAYDIAGKGIADARGMHAAIALAVKMAARRLSDAS
jgi:4-hydroxythreonine-4-phosphate dehydrogenase